MINDRLIAEHQYIRQQIEIISNGNPNVRYYIDVCLGSPNAKDFRKKAYVVIRILNDYNLTGDKFIKFFNDNCQNDPDVLYDRIMTNNIPRQRFDFTERKIDVKLATVPIPIRAFAWED